MTTCVVLPVTCVEWIVSLGGSGGKSSDKPRRTTQTDKSQEESGQRRDDHSSGRGSGRGRRSLPGRRLVLGTLLWQPKPHTLALWVTTPIVFCFRSHSRSPERTRLMRRSSPGSQRSLGSGRNPNRGRRRSRCVWGGGRTRCVWFLLLLLKRM